MWEPNKLLHRTRESTRVFVRALRAMFAQKPAPLTVR